MHKNQNKRNGANAPESNLVETARPLIELRRSSVKIPLADFRKQHEGKLSINKAAKKLKTSNGTVGRRWTLLGLKPHNAEKNKKPTTRALLDLFESGLPLEEAAAKINRHPGSLSRLWRKAGFKEKRHKRYPEAEMLWLFGQTGSVTETARKIGMNRSYLSRRLKSIRQKQEARQKETQSSLNT